MSRIAYVNGRYRPLRDAHVHIEDRGYQFADGVYEVCEVRDGRLVDERRHLERLQRSLSELRIRLPMPLPALSVVLHETVRRNRVRDGIVYLQITRGDAPRGAHAFPPPEPAPAVVVTARTLDREKGERAALDGIAVITLPDQRWPRVDIKSVSLLPNVLAKQAAREQGAREAWLVDSRGFVTEGSSSNAWIVTADRKLVTRPADTTILRGISRTVLLDAIRAQDLVLEERPFTVAEAAGAREGLLPSASPHAVAAALRREFHRHAEFS